jgi:hypothetical protein
MSPAGRKSRQRLGMRALDMGKAMLDFPII